MPPETLEQTPSQLQSIAKHTEPIALFDTRIDEEDIQAVETVLRSGWISMGKAVQQLETDFAQKHSREFPLHGVAVSNGTAALHLALHILDLQPGDEVILPSLTFVATANAVRMVGATPIFADVKSKEDWTLSPQSVLKSITPNTKAILPMHYGGYLADMYMLSEISQQYNLHLIEDAAHAPLATRSTAQRQTNEIGPGTLGDLACFSFYSNKNMTTGEGGMILTRHEKYAQALKLCRSHGMTTSSMERAQGAGFYEVERFGFNYRMSDIQGALGCTQFKKLPQDLNQRKHLTEYYRTQFQKTSLLSHEKGHIHIPFSDYPGTSSHYIFPILVSPEHRLPLVQYLKERNIQTSYHYPPVHTLAHYANHCLSQSNKPHLKHTEAISQGLITLPLYYSLQKFQIDRIVETIHQYYKKHLL